MSRSEDIGHHRTAFNTIKRFSTQNGRVDADLAGSSELGRKIPVGVSRGISPSRGTSGGALSWRRTHVTRKSTHISGALTGSHRRGHLLRPRAGHGRSGPWRVNRCCPSSKVEGVVKQWSMNNITGTIILGTHPGDVDLLRWRVAVPPSHHFGKTTPP